MKNNMKNNMKKSILFFVAMLSVAATKAASLTPPDTLVVNKPNRVTVITSDSLQTIHIEGKDGNPQYNYRNTLQLVDSNYVSTSGIDNDFSFSIGPLHKRSGKTKYPHNEIVTHFFVGFNATPGMPNTVDVSTFRSWELWWVIAEYNYIATRHHGFSAGFGVDWRNYRTRDDVRFALDDDEHLGLTGYDNGVAPKFSRIKVFSLTFPIQYKYSAGKFGFSLGPVINLNTHASVLSEWKENGRTVKESHKGIHVNPVTIDLMATLRAPFGNYYFKYSPSHLVKDGWGLRFHTLSFGVFL